MIFALFLVLVRDGSNEHPQAIFLCKNKKINVDYLPHISRYKVRFIRVSLYGLDNVS